jgi:glucan phosphorylase
VFLNDGRELQKQSTDLVNATNFLVDYAFEKMTDEQQQKQKEKCERAREQVVLEEHLKKLGQEKRNHHDKKEFEAMCEQIVKYVESDGKTQQYTFKTYLSMMEQLRTPFKTEIDGHSITVSAADTAIMLKTSAIEIIKKHVLGKKQRSSNDNQNPRMNKRQRPNG